MGGTEIAESTCDTALGGFPRTRRSRSKNPVNPQDELEAAIDPPELARVRSALSQGADPHRNPGGGSALWRAAFSGRVELVEVLVMAGARVERDEAFDGRTSVHDAAESGDVGVLRLLLDAGGRSVLGRFDYLQRTPLTCAVDAKHLEAATLLIRAGSDVNAHDEPRIGETALHHAARNGDVKMARLLLDAGADPTIPGWMQLTPAHVATGPQADKLRRLMGKARQRRSRERGP